jgi:hypothetical protein
MKENQIDLSAGPDPLPKAGDTVNYVHAVNRIIPAKVMSVIEGTEGRAITVINPDLKAKGPVRVTHRPKAALAGNTWHWPAKAVAMLLLLACMAVTLVMPASAALPTYHTFSAIGNAAAPATVILPADPNSQIRVVSLFYSSDTNTAQLSLISGSTAYSLTATNLATTSITNLIDSTNGLSGGSGLILQHGSGDFTNSVSSWGTYISGTNTSGYVTNQAFLVTGSGGFGTLTTVGDNIYLMTNAVSLYIGSGTNQMNGDDIYSGYYGRPVQATLSPANWTNRIYVLSAHYDSQSQP